MTKAEKREENIENFYRQGFLNRIGKSLFTDHFAINPKAGTIARIEVVVDPKESFNISIKPMGPYKKPSEYLKDLGTDQLGAELNILNTLLNI